MSFSLRVFTYYYLVFFFAELSSAAFIQFPTGKTTLYTQGMNRTGEPLSIGRKSCASIMRSPGVANILRITFGKESDVEPGSLKSEFVSVDDGIVKLDFGAGANIDAVPIGEPYPVFRRVFEEAMGGWQGYTPAQQQLMREINDQIAVHRVHWIQFQFRPEDIPEVALPADAQGVAALRMVDGSQPRTKSMGVTMDYSRDTEGDPTKLMEALTPIELSPKNRAAGYLLPFRKPGKVTPTHLMHIGVATNVRRFQGGMFVLMGHAARLLDMHYNNSMMKTFKSTQEIEKLDMHVVTSAVPRLAEVYKKFGFEDWGDGYTKEASEIIVVDTAGQANIQSGPRPTLPDGMVLLVMKAELFLQRFQEYADVPFIKMVKETEDSTQEWRFGDPEVNGQPKSDEIWLERNQQTLASVTPIRDIETYGNRFLNLTRLNFIMVRAAERLLEGKPYPLVLDRPEAEYFAGDPLYKALEIAYRDVVEEFYRIVAGTASHLRTREWAIVELTAISLLTDGPLEGMMDMPTNPANKKYEYIEALENVLLK